MVQQYSESDLRLQVLSLPPQPHPNKSFTLRLLISRVLTSVLCSKRRLPPPLLPPMSGISCAVCARTLDRPPCRSARFFRRNGPIRRNIHICRVAFARKCIVSFDPGFEYSLNRSGDDWTTWKNVEGQTTAIRNHLKTHDKLWSDLVLLKQLKGWDRMGTSNKNSPSGEREAFSLPGFYERLVKWIAVDDQVRLVV